MLKTFMIDDARLVAYVALSSTKTKMKDTLSTSQPV